MPVTLVSPTWQELATADTRGEDGALKALLGSEEFSRGLVTPGELITANSQFMRGHGTYARDSTVFATVAGTVERVNKLISVRPVKSRYRPEIGDLVVGRITDVGPKRWRVDIGAQQDAVLMLSAINLPGGILRRKSESDELQMRQFFQEGDLLVAEVQALFQDGAASLHSRSLKYGKLRNGHFASIPPSLVVRSSKSFAQALPGGLDVMLGVNGYIWVSKHRAESLSTVSSITRLEEEASEDMYSNVNDPIDVQTMVNISRFSNCILALASCNVPVDMTRLVQAYEASMEYDLQQLLEPTVAQQLADEVLK